MRKINIVSTDRSSGLSKAQKQTAPRINTKEDLLKFAIFLVIFFNSKQSKRGIREIRCNSSYWVILTYQAILCLPCLGNFVTQHNNKCLRSQTSLLKNWNSCRNTYLRLVLAQLSSHEFFKFYECFQLCFNDFGDTLQGHSTNMFLK